MKQNTTQVRQKKMKTNIAQRIGSFKGGLYDAINAIQNTYRIIGGGYVICVPAYIMRTSGYDIEG